MERLALAAAAVLLLVPAALLTPRAGGDSGEYYLTAESLLNHGTPDLRGEDMASLQARMARQPVDGSFRTMRSYREGRGRRLYALHFFTYPATTLPVRAVLRRTGANEFKAFALTNALLLLAALAVWLFAAPYPPRWRVLGAALLLVSPIGWFVRLTHAEVYSASLVIAALACWRAGAVVAATLLAALAALQNPPLVILTGVMALLAALAPAPGRARRAALAALAALPAAIPYAFNLWAFGTPSVIADENVALRNVAIGRALELLFDLNLGLLPYAPLTVPLALAATAWGLARAETRAVVAWCWVSFVGMALVCSAMHDWNHGTSGPSRYAVWLFPLLVLLVCEVFSRARPGWPQAAATAALLAQAGVFAARSGFRAPEDYLQHSWAARQVLRFRPGLYRPTREIFIERTVHADWPHDSGEGPFVYAEDGRCRKALARKKDAEVLRARCGGEPAAFTRFVQEVRERGGGRGEWTYVDY
jgi:hypothetical protein